MNNKQAIIVGAAAIAIPYAVQAISSRIPIRRRKQDVVAETDEQIVESFNGITRQWEEVQRQVNSHPAMQRIDKILAQFDNPN